MNDKAVLIYFLCRDKALVDYMGNAELIESDHVDVVDARCVESRSCFLNNVWY